MRYRIESLGGISTGVDYEAIVRDQDSFEAGIPESFNVLVKEMRSLGLNVELLEGEPEPAEEGADT